MPGIEAPGVGDGIETPMHVDGFAKQVIDPFTSLLLGSDTMGSVEFQIAVIPNHGPFVSNLLVLGLLLSPSG